MEKRLQELERTINGTAFYWHSDIPALIGDDTPSLSSFRRRAKEGKIRTVDVGGREIAYNAEDVRSFLQGKFALPRGGARKRTKQAGVSVPEPAAGSYEELTIDVAHAGDLLHLYLLESEQLDYMRAIVPPVLNAWIQANDLVYWLLYNPSNRTEIVAMLGILPLKEETIRQHQRAEVPFSQIPASEILAYKPGGHYHTVIVSAATKSGQQDAIMPLLQRAFTDWCNRSVFIESIYAFMSGKDEDSPLARIVASCAFVPQDEDGKLWRLQPFYRQFQPAPFVRDYRNCVSTEKKGDPQNMLLITTEEKELSIDDLRDLFTQEKQEASKRDFTEIVLRHFVVGDDGQIIRTDLDQRKQRRTLVRPMRDDNDIRATLRINASLFGPPRKYTEDQLVELRRPWIEKNQDIYRVLEIDGEVRGFLFVMPLPMDVINRVLTGELRVGDIPVNNLQEYRPGTAYDLYLQTLGVHKSIQGVQKRIAGMYLLAGMHKLFVDLARRGVELRAVYTRSNEIDGVKVAAALDMDEIFVPGVDDKLVLKLDFTDESKQSLHAYRTALEQYKSGAAIH
jgi:hypothetical protein